MEVNQLWAGRHYLHPAAHGVYLFWAVVLDAYSRRVIGLGRWGRTLEAGTGGYRLSPWRCGNDGPEPGPGASFRSRAYSMPLTNNTDLLKQHDIQISMSRKREIRTTNAAPAESFIENA